MRYFSLVVPLLAAFSTVATPLKRTVAQVEADITNIRNSVNTLDGDIHTFTAAPSNNLVAALAIHTAAGNLVSTINQGTTDVNATPTPSESDSQAILTLVQGLVTPINTALTDTVNAKADFVALPIGGIPALVKQDLANIASATTAFENALIAKAPSDLKSQAQSLANSINAAIANAQAAYAQF